MNCRCVLFVFLLKKYFSKKTIWTFKKALMILLLRDVLQFQIFKMFSSCKMH